MDATAEDNLCPDEAIILRHVEMLHGGVTGGLPWECRWHVTLADTRTGALNHGLSFGLDQLEDGAAYMAQGNAQNGASGYICGALLSPDMPATGRARDAHFAGSMWVWADLDTTEAVSSAKERWEAAPPSLVVITGKIPHTRIQAWWRLTEAATDMDWMRAALNGICDALDGDSMVTNPTSLMRLAGTVAWPWKAERQPELTRLSPLYQSGRQYDPDFLTHVFPPTTNRPRTHRAHVDYSGPVRETTSLGFEGRYIDYRHKYARDLVYARFASYAGEHGAVPSADELFEDVWETYQRQVNMEREGKAGEDYVRYMCRYTVERFERGHLQGLTTLEDLVRQDQEYRRAYEEAKAAGAKESPEDEPPVANEITATAYKWRDPKAIPPRPWVYGKILLRRYVTLTVAPGGLGKTNLCMAESVSLAAGKPILGEEMPEGAQGAWYLNLEDSDDENERKIAAILKHHDVQPAEVDGRLFIDSGRGREKPIVIAEETKNGVVIVRPLMDAIIAEMKAKNITALSVDPFVKCHRVNENDNSAIDAVAREWVRVADEANAAVQLVHHVRKGNGAHRSITADDGRGAAALKDAARIVRTLNGMSDEEAEKFGVGLDDAELFFRHTSAEGKVNLTRRTRVPTWYRLVSVGLGNATLVHPEDEVGVVELWTPPQPFEGVDVGDLQKALAEVERVNAPPVWKNTAEENKPFTAEGVVANELGIEFAHAKRLLGSLHHKGAVTYEMVHDSKKGRGRRQLRVVWDHDFWKPDEVHK